MTDLVLPLDDHTLEWITIYQLRKKTIQDFERIFTSQKDILINKYSGTDENKCVNEIKLNLAKLLSLNQSQLDHMMIKEVNKALQNNENVEVKTND